MKSPICEMLGIEFPLFAFSHCRDVVAAVSRAGGFGVLGATGHSPQSVHQRAEVDRRPRRRQALRPRRADPRRTWPPPARPASPTTALKPASRTRTATSPPTCSPRPASSLPEPQGVSDDAAAAVRSRRTRCECWRRRSSTRSRLIANALGVPPPAMIEMGKRHGVPVAALVGAKEHAIRQVNAGVDILVVQGTEAGGHCGEVTTMVLVPEVLQAIKPIRDVPVLAAGGIMNGAQMAACMAMGAAGRLDRLGLAGHDRERDQRDLPREDDRGRLAATPCASRSRTGKPARQLRSAWTEAWERRSGQPRRPADAADDPGQRERPALGRARRRRRQPQGARDGHLLRRPGRRPDRPACARPARWCRTSRPSSSRPSSTWTACWRSSELTLPDIDLVALWEDHTRFEFEARDVDATMATMVAGPVRQPRPDPGRRRRPR